MKPFSPDLLQQLPPLSVVRAEIARLEAAREARKSEDIRASLTSWAIEVPQINRKREVMCAADGPEPITSASAQALAMTSKTFSAFIVCSSRRG